MQHLTAGLITAADGPTKRASAGARPCAVTAQGRTAPGTISVMSWGALQSRAQSVATHKRNTPTAEVTTSHSSVGVQRRQKSRERHARRGVENPHDGR